MLVRYGATAFCREMDVALQELSIQLEQADALGLYNDPRVATGRAVYDYNTDFWTTKWFYVPWLQADACTKDTAEVVAAAQRVREAIIAAGAKPSDPLRPDYQPSEGNPLKLVPTWAIVLGGLGLAAYLFGPAIRAGSSRIAQPKLSGYRRRRRR